MKRHRIRPAARLSNGFPCLGHCFYLKWGGQGLFRIRDKDLRSQGPRTCIAVG